MFDPTEGQLDHDFEESMRMFEKALASGDEVIKPVAPKRVLYAFDGSAQDQSVIEAARYMQSRFECASLILDARERTPENDDNTSVAFASGLPGAELLPRREGTSYEQILAAIEGFDPDMVVAPCPFGRDLVALGPDSAGTVIDVLLSRCNRPMLFIRQSDQPIDRVLQNISFIVAAETDAEWHAAAWTFGLAAESARISLDVVIDKEQLENLKQLMSVLDPERVIESDDLNNALADSHTALHAAMQNAAQAAGVSYRLVPKANTSAPPVIGNEAEPLLIALPMEVTDRFVEGFVLDRLRRSPHPVLVVPHQSTSVE